MQVAVKRKKEFLRLQRSKYWMVYFEDNSSQVIWSNHSCIKLGTLERTKNEVNSTLYFQKISKVLERIVL